MITYEKILSILHHYKDAEHSDISNFYFKDIANAIMELVKHDDDWIPVEKELPEHNVSVLVYIPDEDGHITSGMWDISEKWVLLDEYRTPECKVTHWSRLKQPPSETKENESGHVPKVKADKDGWVRCPYCKKLHRHGGNGNGIASGHRHPDCGNEIGYIVIPHKDAVK